MISLDESTPFPAQHIDDYTESKHLAETVVLVAPPALRVCVVRPGGIFGPGDKQVRSRRSDQGSQNYSPIVSRPAREPRSPTLFSAVTTSFTSAPGQLSLTWPTSTL
jgi:nucleoside-diphosphate-sugar epimerase